MKRTLLFSLIALALAYVVYISLAFMVNYEGIYQKFRKQMAAAGYNVKASHINVERFPIPRIEVLGVTIGDILTANKLEINFTPISTFSFKPEINIIKVDGVKTYAPDSRVDFMRHSTMMSKLLMLVPKLPRMKLNNITIVDDVTKELSYLNNVIIDANAPGNQVTLNWDRESSTKVSYTNVEKGVNVQINYSGPSYNMKLSEVYKKGQLKNGTLRYNVKNLRNFMSERYDDVDLLMTKIRSEQPLELNCKFKIDADRVRVTDIKMQSKSIDMTGSIDLYDSEKADEINLDFDHLDFSELLDAPNMENVKTSHRKERLSLDDVVRNFNITAKKINIASTYVQDFVMEAEVDKGKMRITSFEGIIGQSEGKFNAKGNITQNQYRSLFDGKVFFEHKDLNRILSDLGYKKYATSKEASFSLSSDVRATPIDYKLNNLFMKVGAFNASGDAAIKLIGSMPRVNLALSLSALDLFDKDIPVLNNVVQYLSSLTQDMKSKNYLQKYIPIREMNYLGDIDITFNNIQVNNNEIDKLRIITGLSPGNIVLNSIYFQDEGSYFTGTGYLSAAGITPKMEFKMPEAYIITDKFDIPNIVKGLKTIYEDYDMDKIKFKTDLNAQTIKQKDMTYKDFRIKARNRGILWDIESLKGNFADGNFDASGSLRMDAMNLNLAYAYNDFNIKALSRIIPFNIFGMQDGWMSMNGMLSTNGNNNAELLYNLYTKSAFIAKNVIWNNFDIDGLVKHTSSSSYEKKNLPKDAKLFMSSPKTKMKLLDGEVELDKGVFRIFDIDFETEKSKGVSDLQFNMYDTTITANTNFIFRSKAANIYDPRVDVKFPIKVTGKLGQTKKDFDFKEFDKYLDRKAKTRGWMRQSQFPPQISQDTN